MHQAGQTQHNPTDRTRWRLRVGEGEGRQQWEYLSEAQSKAEPQTVVDKYWLGLATGAKSLPKPKNAFEAAKNGFEFYKQLQTKDGFWAGEYGGPMFLIPGLTIAYYVTGTPFPSEWQQEVIQYLFHRANKEDGGWGIHIEGVSSVFGTALNYVVLRLLGVDAEHPVCVKARQCLHGLGGATGIPSWGKFWLSVLNCYEWDGQNPIPPELWLLPQWAPVHPYRFWVHTRCVYQPMSYLYGIQATMPLTDLVRDLRQELYVEPFESIHWPSQRNNVCEVDVYYPHTTLYNILNKVLFVVDKIPGTPWVRKQAVKEALKQCQMEDDSTYSLDIGPVNKALNMIVAFFAEGRESKRFQRHVKGNLDFMWMSKEGMMMNGTNGSQLWDTAFMTQAAIEAGLAQLPENRESMKQAYAFLDRTQIRRNPPHLYENCRHETLGAWPFSNQLQGYTVSDCTAEGMKSVLQLQYELDYIRPVIADERCEQAVGILLRMQNGDGGFSSYEPIRGADWLELINPAEVFGNIMREYNYPECTSSVILGLSSFKKQFPKHRLIPAIDDALDRAMGYIVTAQKPDGSWYGSWAICYTYGTYFCLEALTTVGWTFENSPEIKQACEFLISKQMEDGGWGESYKSCETHTYVHHAQSQVVQTAWSVLALMAAGYPDQTPIKRGIDLIMKRQLANGEWAQEAIEGVFNHSTMISYPNYKFSFTIWALGRYHNKYGKK